MKLKEQGARELPDDDRDLAEFARKIRRAIESPLKPVVHGVPLDRERLDTLHRNATAPS